MHNYNHGRYFKNASRKIADIFGLYIRPNESTIPRLVKQFYETGSVEDRKEIWKIK